jgi:hypothetical protein
MGKWVKSKSLTLEDQAQVIGAKLKAKDNLIQFLAITQVALLITTAVLAYLILK